MSLLAFSAGGTGSGAPLVLLHGLTFSRQTWQPITEILRQRHPVIAVDLPGHGDSDGSAADPRAVVDRLHATLETVGVDRPVMIGHSAGALTASGYAAGHPTSGVINIDQPMLVAPFAGLLQQMAPTLRGPDFPAAFSMFENSIGVQDLPEPQRSRVMATRQIRQATVLDHWHLPMTDPPAEMQATVDQMLDAIRVPYLYLAGDELPQPVRDHLRAHLPRVEIVVWPGTGHVGHLAEPRRFADLVDEFLRTSESP